MKKIIITEEERSRILGMHQSATSRQYLNEDILPEWTEYYKAKQSIKIPEGGAYVSASYRVTPEEAKEGEVRLPFKYTIKLVGGQEQEPSGQYYYVCANTPTDPTLKVGTTIDSSDKPKPDILEALNLGKTPFIKLFQVGCQAVYNIQKQNKQEAQQVAGQKASAQKQAEKSEVQKQVQNAIAKGYIKKTVGQDGVAKYTSLGKGAFTIGMFQHNLPKGTDMTQDINDALK